MPVRVEEVARRLLVRARAIGARQEDDEADEGDDRDGDGDHVEDLSDHGGQCGKGPGRAPHGYAARPVAVRLLFVCLGNSCRSQMAEAFARAYGSDVMVPASAGFTPASRVAPDTMQAMAEKGLNLKDHFPKSIRHLGRAQFDIVVDMSGLAIPEDICREIRGWDVEDPVYMDFEDHCAIRDKIDLMREFGEQ